MPAVIQIFFFILSLSLSRQCPSSSSTSSLPFPSPPPFPPLPSGHPLPISSFFLHGPPPLLLSRAVHGSRPCLSSHAARDADATARGAAQRGGGGEQRPAACSAARSGGEERCGVARCVAAQRNGGGKQRRRAAAGRVRRVAERELGAARRPGAEARPCPEPSRWSITSGSQWAASHWPWLTNPTFSPPLLAPQQQPLLQFSGEHPPPPNLLCSLSILLSPSVSRIWVSVLCCHRSTQACFFFCCKVLDLMMEIDLIWEGKKSSEKFVRSCMR